VSALPGGGEIGCYGKIPSKGDFVTRNLPRSFIEPWDRWLQAALERSRAQLGEEWLDVYLTSPLWRYALSPGLCGQQVWAGILMPSVDRVGRYFPFTLARQLPHNPEPLRVIAELEPWYAEAESLVLSTLDDDFDINAFTTSLEMLGAEPEVALPAAAPPAAAEAGAGLGWRMELPLSGSLTGLYPELAARALREIFFGFSLWTTTGSEQVAPSLLVCQGLPAIDGYSAMLLGNWRDSPWQRDAVSDPLPGLEEGDTQPPRELP